MWRIDDSRPGRRLDRAYYDRLHEERVWLFDGAASAYVKTSVPPARNVPT